MMPKILLIFKRYKLYRIVAVLSILHFNDAFSQNLRTISYGEKINLGIVDNDTQFYIDGKITKHLRGNAVNDFVFNYPGDYRIRVVEKKHSQERCDHLHLPKEILVKVSRIRMSFGSEILFSEPILKNWETAGIRLDVNVLIQTYDHLPIQINQADVKVAGIGSAIIAHPDPSITELPEGRRTIQYILKGVVTENAYLMFDFIDANENTQSIALAQPVKSKI